MSEYIYEDEGRDEAGNFSDENDGYRGDDGETFDKYNSISSLILKGKKALRSGGSILTIKRNLVKELDVLSDTPSTGPSELDPENEMQSVVLDNWIEEVLRFLALKTITCDNTEPCQLLPGHAVGVGWKVLMITPSIYAKVCLAMGNRGVFDHNPTETSASKVLLKHRVKRHNATLRAYERYFDQQPPALYWNFHEKRKIDEDSIIASMGKFCGIDSSFLTDTFAQKQPTNADPTMSPDMPEIT